MAGHWRRPRLRSRRQPSPSRRRSPDQPMEALTEASTWMGQLETVMLRHAGQHVLDLPELPPLAECHQLGMTPLEVYLWHVRKPEFPAGDVYRARARA